MKYIAIFCLSYFAFIPFASSEEYKEIKFLVFNEWGNEAGKLGTVTPEGEYMPPGPYNVDNKGNIWIVDPANNRVVKFDSTGNFSYQFHCSESRNVLDIAISPYGLIFLRVVVQSDTLPLFHKIICYSPKGEKLYEFEIPPRHLWPTVFGGNYIEIDEAGNIFADFTNYYVIKFSAYGKELTSQYDRLGWLRTKGNYYIKIWHSGGRIKFGDKILNKWGDPILDLGEIPVNPCALIGFIGIDAKGNFYIIFGDTLLDHVRCLKIDPVGSILADFKIKRDYFAMTLSSTVSYRVDNKGRIYVAVPELSEEKIEPKSIFRKWRRLIIWKYEPLPTYRGQLYEKKLLFSVTVGKADSQIVQTLDREGGYRSVSQFTVDESNNVYLVDSGYIKKFTPTGKFLCKFKLRKEKGILVGLAANSTYLYSLYISRGKPEGSCRWTLFQHASTRDTVIRILQEKTVKDTAAWEVVKLIFSTYPQGAIALDRDGFLYLYDFYSGDTLLQLDSLGNVRKKLFAGKLSIRGKASLLYSCGKYYTIEKHLTRESFFEIRDIKGNKIWKHKGSCAYIIGIDSTGMIYVGYHTGPSGVISVINPKHKLINRLIAEISFPPWWDIVDKTPWTIFPYIIYPYVVTDNGNIYELNWVKSESKLDRYGIERRSIKNVQIWCYTLKTETSETSQ